ncbi:MAG: hypothetical protein GEU68_16115 [Actinobacteria bacterium]|nr:hypothetical protein [Actinomycetota bacterium]
MALREVGANVCATVAPYNAGVAGSNPSPPRRKGGRPPRPSNQVELDPEVVKALERQRQAFRAKFGRDPGPTDPVFFDPNADEPTPIDPERFERDMIEVMSRAGIDPALMYATNKTGLKVTEMNQYLLSDEDLAEWQEATEEYHELEERLGAGEE